MCSYFFSYEATESFILNISEVQFFMSYVLFKCAVP